MGGSGFPADSDPLLRLQRLADKTFWAERCPEINWRRAVSDGVAALGGVSVLKEMVASRALDCGPVVEFRKPGRGGERVRGVVVANRHPPHFVLGLQNATPDKFLIVTDRREWLEVWPVYQKRRFDWQAYLDLRDTLVEETLVPSLTGQAVFYGRDGWATGWGIHQPNRTVNREALEAALAGWCV
jgi:hypothetical protein